jgi:type I restriction enzyme S subunit
MEVKPGYKQTEVGVIPEEWEVQPLGELSDFVTSGSRGWAQFYSESGALFIRSQNVRDGRLSFEDVQYVTPPTGAEGNRTKVRLNDLLITITGNSVGNVALVEQTFDEAYISQHVGLVRLKEPSRGAYVCRYLSPNSPGNPQIAGSQSGQSKPGLNLQNLKDFQIALPPTLSELQAIATALSDVDGLLGGLDRLIAKKRDLKQAAMQQLLTGQTRLPGFHGEWEVKRLGDVGKFLKGSGVKKDQTRSGSLACVRYGELYTLHNDVVREFQSWISPEVAATAVRLKQGDILFAGSGETKEEIGKCAAFVSDVEAYAGGDIVILRPDTCDSVYLGYYLNTGSIARQKASRGQGDAVVHISSSALSDVRCKLPPHPEQTAIAEVLSEMDGELAVLEQRREKTRALKQAMMQEILTGRTRLI